MAAKPKSATKTPRRARPPAIDGLEWASQAREAAVAWLVKGAIPAGSVVMIEGRKAVGKSSVLAALAAATTAGRLFPHWAGPTSGRVIWMGSEDPWESVVVPRLRAAGADLGLVARLADVEGSLGRRRMMLPDDLPLLRERLAAARPAVLVLDPYVSLAAGGLDLRVEQQARSYLEPLAQVLAELGITGLLTRHIRKSSYGDARDAGLGSGAVGNVARAVLRCDEHPMEHGQYVLSVVAGNWGRVMPTQVYRLQDGLAGCPVVEWVGESNLGAQEIAEGRGTESQRDEATDADRLLLDLLAAGWLRYSTIWQEAQNAGVTQTALRSAKVRLRVRSRRLAFGASGHWEWGLPGAGKLSQIPPKEGEGGGTGARATPMARRKGAPPQKPRRKRNPAIDGARAPVPPPPCPSEEENGHAH